MSTPQINHQARELGKLCGAFPPKCPIADGSLPDEVRQAVIRQCHADLKTGEELADSDAVFHRLAGTCPRRPQP